MNPDDILGRVVGALDKAGIPYMLTGSFASSFHGVPRASQDIDIVVDPTEEQLTALVSSFPAPDYYVDLEVAREARREESMFNVVDMNTGWKIDLIIRKSRPYSRQEFDRRVKAVLHGQELFVTSAEDIVLVKLEWAKIGRSERQIEDVAAILKLRRGSLNEEYLGRWVRELGIADQWDRARRLAGLEP